jgi:hypothetical protein
MIYICKATKTFSEPLTRKEGLWDKQLIGMLEAAHRISE